MEIVRTAARIVLTVIPVLLIKNHKTRRHLKHAALNGVPISEDRTNTLLKRIRHRTLLFHLLFFIPGALFWSTIFASLERTPLTGRWRLIILSPEEEDEIAAQLAGPGWYQAVGEILSQDGPAQLIPPSDWRYGWVRDTLRELERTIPVLIDEEENCKNWSQGGIEHIPLPPPAEYPLRPRPRASEYLRMFCESMCKRHVSPVPHSIPGPPYSLLVVDKPEASNAFSYGFGPDGGGGIVVYSGFLDEILSRAPPENEVVGPEPQSSVPTASQTAELAILLSHELAHLVLSHHLETLSSATIIIPGVMSIISDIIRVVIFPVTMIFGPFVNDAVAQLGKLGSGEMEKVGEYCTSVKQEIEADVVSVRLLAHAGYDARKAVTFWEHRTNSLAECSSDHKEHPSSSFVHKITGSQHPVNEVRVNSLKGELLRWETERRAELRRRLAPPPSNHINLATA
ncbi:peptidase family M48-domain-containing protein [Mycena rosella]|uniref:Peptidase family M48-domain-containing protein n=1 Tax=Mycena rosella TaxID=1033263 RepID=A0AAD7MA39_MYCRO|nr:peptidase family M48-domain-containing protein [Mycena rosella]